MSFVNIKEGVHRNQPVYGIFPVMKAYNGKEVTVSTDGVTKPFKCEKARVKVSTENFFYCDSKGNKVDERDAMEKMNPGGGAGAVQDDALVQEFLDNESDADAMKRIEHSFHMLDRVADGAIEGIIRGLVVSGPPGVGKSFGITKMLEEATLFTGLAAGKQMYKIIHGSVSCIGLYQILWDNQEEGMVTVFDDSDGILRDEDSLNMLKAALDSGGKRVLSYYKESKVLAERGIDNEFEFKGSIIFLTNQDFQKQRDSALGAHLEAIMSRCHYMSLDIKTKRDKLLRIRQVVEATDPTTGEACGMLEEYDFTVAQKETIVDYIEKNADYMLELSLRMVKKIADLVKMDPTGWVGLVESTCMRDTGKFKRLMEEAEAKANS